MKYDVNKITELAEEDYEKAWVDTASLLEKKGKKFRLLKKGKPHPLYEFIEKARKKMIKLGFEEVVLPMIIEASHVYREYGPEAPLILDRLFYLAGLPRPEIGLSLEKEKMIKEIVGKIDLEELKNILREYKIGKIEADDLIEVFIIRLDIKEQKATELIEKVFTEFKSLKPKPSNLTLRSHTTALWFPVLASMQGKKEIPIQLFHIGPKFRREQTLDKTHLYTSNTISCVIMTNEITLEDGIEISKKILRSFGFKELKFEIKKGTSKYYAPQMEFEVFIKHSISNEWLEVGDGGFYSPVSCANYSIQYPIFNFGMGIERILMIQENESDIRNLVYPYFYKDLTFEDEEIVEKIGYEERPRTKIGKEVMSSIIKIAEDHKDDQAPKKITAWEGKIYDKKIEVIIWENETGVKLLGPAAFNEIWVNDGMILGLKPGQEKREDSLFTGIRYIDGIAALVARRIEELGKRNKLEFRIKMVRRPSDINISIDESVRYFINSNNKKIDIRGPVFVGITCKVK
ncbi:MAG: O-phosphoserine--tRNA ligase [Candidatus Lokiarchaeota archaeon]|nr:O-phosphoserine--tRNA ligase [Candidatus Lokiarchaeota archaeon]